MHRDLVAQASKPLDRMMSIGMLERTQGYAELKGVTKATFGLFVEWLSKGYYTTQKPQIDVYASSITLRAWLSALQKVATRSKTRTTNSHDDPLTHHVQPQVSNGIFVPKSDIRKLPSKPCPMSRASKFTSSRVTKPKKTLKLREQFASKSSLSRPSVMAQPKPTSNEHNNAAYAEVFLSHARLYVFADEKDVPALKALTLDELRATLSVFTLHDNRIQDIIALFAYAYENTHWASDKLRALLGEYMAMEAKKLTTNEAFKALVMEDGGPMFDDLMQHVADRLT